MFSILKTLYSFIKLKRLIILPLKPKLNSKCCTIKFEWKIFYQNGGHRINRKSYMKLRSRVKSILRYEFMDVFNRKQSGKTVKETHNKTKSLENYFPRALPRFTHGRNEAFLPTAPFDVIKASFNPWAKRGLFIKKPLLRHFRLVSPTGETRPFDWKIINTS